jgi:hypothetical protein
MAIDEPKPRGPRPELSVRRREESPRAREPAPGGFGFEPVPAPFTPEQRERAQRLILARGIQAARELDPSLLGRCIECFTPVEGTRVFCSDACIRSRVTRNLEQVAAIASERERKPPRR